jgi:multicomponent Na+:H+ antiporter subunit F
MRVIRYLVGIFIIAFALGLFLFHFKIFIYPHLSYLAILKRGLGVIFLSAFLCLWRVFKGPTPSDRIVSTDMLGILIIGVCALLSITTRRSWYMDIGIAWALQSFISTLALAKFLQGQDFDE